MAIADAITLVGMIVSVLLQIVLLNRQSLLNTKIEKYKIVIPRELQEIDKVVTWLDEGMGMYSSFMFMGFSVGNHSDKVSKVKETTDYFEETFRSWDAKHLPNMALVGDWQRIHNVDLVENFNKFFDTVEKLVTLDFEDFVDKMRNEGNEWEKMVGDQDQIGYIYATVRLGLKEIANKTFRPRD